MMEIIDIIVYSAIRRLLWDDDGSSRCILNADLAHKAWLAQRAYERYLWSI